MSPMDDIQRFYPIFRVLARYHVRYVLTGSIAALLHGVSNIHPNDLDIVPYCIPHNLACLAAGLSELQAVAKPKRGEWRRDSRHEWRWHAFEVSQAQDKHHKQVLNYKDFRTFDRVFATRYGRLDIVPEIAGTYPDLIQRSQLKKVTHLAVPIVSLEDLLATLTVPRRTKDVELVKQLRHLQSQPTSSIPAE